jgi:rhomboid protease GluP
MDQLEREPEPQRARVRLQRRTPATWALIGANVLAFLWMLSSGADALGVDSGLAVALGANFGPATEAGEWWRILSSAFLHGGFLHLAFNMWALRVLGPFMESFLGSTAFLVLFLACAAGASLCSVAAHPDGVSLGASGGVFALLGAHASFFLRHRREMPGEVFRGRMRMILMVIGLNLLIGFSMPQVDNAAHVGGLLLGVLGGVLLDRPLVAEPRMSARRWTGVLLLLAALAPLAWLALERVRGLG